MSLAARRFEGRGDCHAGVPAAGEPGPSSGRRIPRAGYRGALEGETQAAGAASRPLRPTIRSHPRRSRWARSCSPTRASPAAAKRSCATCHRPERAFTDGRRRARALSGAPLRRNTPSLWNLAWSKHFFWDGRAPSLEAQVRMPIEEAQEMGGDWPQILRRLGADAGLVAQFRVAFPEEPQAVDRRPSLKALAAYVRSLVSPPTRFDAWIDGDAQALQPAEERGFRLFIGKAGCVLCHVGWRFTDDRFHDIGLRGARSRAAAPCRAARRASWPSRRRACARSPTPRPTCTTARWRRSRPSSGTTPAASSGGPRWRPT